jgi:hypothetical protein
LEYSAVVEADRDRLASYSAVVEEKRASLEVERDQLIMDTAAMKARHTSTQAERDQLAKQTVGLQDLSASFEVERAHKASLLAEQDQIKREHAELSKTLDLKLAEIATLAKKHAEVHEAHSIVEELLQLERMERESMRLAQENLKQEHHFATEISQQQLLKIMSERDHLSSDCLQLRGIIHQLEKNESNVRDTQAQMEDEMEALNEEHKARIKDAEGNSLREIARLEMERDRAVASDLQLRKALDGAKKTIESQEIAIAEHGIAAEFETGASNDRAHDEALQEIHDLRIDLDAAERERDRALHGSNDIKRSKRIAGLEAERDGLVDQLRQLRSVAKSHDTLELSLRRALDEEQGKVARLEEEKRNMSSTRASKDHLDLSLLAATAGRKYVDLGAESPILGDNKKSVFHSGEHDDSTISQSTSQALTRSPASTDVPSSQRMVSFDLSLGLDEFTPQRKQSSDFEQMVLLQESVDNSAPKRAPGESITAMFSHLA